MRVAFLVGSGISIDAGMPRVGEISEQVFSGRNVIRHSDATYYIDAGTAGRPRDFYRERADATISFVGKLRALADEYFGEYAPDRTADYEDVANLAKQIADAISGEYENPALSPLLSQLRTELGVDLQELMEQSGECNEYVRDVVWRMLVRPVTSVDHLAVIVDACREVGSVDLFDLNHDPVLETALAAAGLPFSDGFTRAAGDVYYWADHFDEPLRHLKLDGSINWFHRTIPDEAWHGLVVARSTIRDPYHERGADGELHSFPADGRPVILVGTFDKPLAYDSSVFAAQHFHFHEALRHHDRLVVIGYGFRDKGINNRLIGWILESPDHRLVVVHGDADYLLRACNTMKLTTRVETACNSSRGGSDAW